MEHSKHCKPILVMKTGFFLCEYTTGPVRDCSKGLTFHCSSMKK